MGTNYENHLYRDYAKEVNKNEALMNELSLLRYERDLLDAQNKALESLNNQKDDKISEKND
jgi:hypothetical protein